MSAALVAKVVAKANQIATALEGQGGDAAAAAAEHMRLFWPPLMREAILKHAAAGGEGLTPGARKAVALMAPTPEPAGPEAGGPGR